MLNSEKNSKIMDFAEISESLLLTLYSYRKNVDELEGFIIHQKFSFSKICHKVSLWNFEYNPHNFVCFFYLLSLCTGHFFQRGECKYIVWKE